MDFTNLTSVISRVKGVKAIVLGGSQSRNEADAFSDYDVGLYYDPDTLDADKLDECMTELDDGHRTGLLQKPGAWGPWINGGAWLTVGGAPVDILLRDLRRVTKVIEDFLAGGITIDYQCGHPFGFVNTIYAAEVFYCRSLWQGADRAVDALKDLLGSRGAFSGKMKEALIERFLWEARFSMDCGRKAAMKGDVHYAMGSAFRTVGAWVQVIFARNERYLMNEKGALRQIDTMPIRPERMEDRVCAAYRYFADRDAAAAYEGMELLHQEIAELAGRGSA